MKRSYNNYNEYGGGFDQEKKQRTGEYEIDEFTKTCLGLWNEMREKSTSDFKRAKLVTKLMKKLETTFVEYSRKHHYARVIQDLIRFGTALHHKTIFDELEEEIISLAKDKYSHFTVLKMIKHMKGDGSDGGGEVLRDRMVTVFRGEMIVCSLHATASQVHPTQPEINSLNDR